MSRTRQLGMTSLLIVAAGFLVATALLLSETDELGIDPRDVSPEWLADRISWEALDPPIDNTASAAGRLRVLWRRHCDQPRVKAFPRNFARHGGTIAAYESGELKLPHSEPVPFELPLTWRRDDRGLTFHAELHSWRFLTGFMDEYAANHERRYIEIVAAVVSDWIEHNPYDNPAHPRAWHEGAVMKRTIVICGLLESLAALNDPDAESILSPVLLLNLLHQHAAYLRRDSSYVPNNNHGIRQDMALLIASLTFPPFANSHEWREIAMARLHEHQIEPGFTKEGVWREPSPGYHLYVMKLWTLIANLLDENDVEGDVDFLQNLRSKSRRYLTHVLTPAGTMPPVGDTEENRLPALLRDAPHVEYAATTGESGSPPATLDGFFPATGVAVLRDTWGDSPQTCRRAMYVHLHAVDVHAEFGHRHADELSVILHYAGRWWITDPGKYTYELDEWRDYIENAHAHNGYVFNGAGLAPNAKPDYAHVSMNRALVADDRMAAVRATSTRFAEPGIEATRTVILLRGRKTLVLLDELSANRDGVWSGMLHFAADLDVKLDNGELVAIAPRSPESLQLVTTADTKPTRRIVKGQRDPLQGWVSPTFGEIELAPTLITELDGSEHTVATVIKIDAPPRLDELRLDTSNTGCRVRWRDAGERVELSVSRANHAFGVTLSDDATAP